MRDKCEVSLEYLTASGSDIPDPVNRDPLELLIEQERPDLPLFTGLTEYQRRVAVKFFVEHKSKAMIAQEENCSEAAVREIIKKITRKIIKQII
jgi:hypothetical protein